MSYKTKSFSKYDDKMDVDKSISIWLKDNANIKIISVNIWGYGEYTKGLIIYETK